MEDGKKKTANFCLILNWYDTFRIIGNTEYKVSVYLLIISFQGLQEVLMRKNGCKAGDVIGTCPHGPGMQGLPIFKGEQGHLKIP